MRKKDWGSRQSRGIKEDMGGMEKMIVGSAVCSCSLVTCWMFLMKQSLQRAWWPQGETCITALQDPHPRHWGGTGEDMSGEGRKGEDMSGEGKKGR